MATRAAARRAAAWRRYSSGLLPLDTEVHGAWGLRGGGTEGGDGGGEVGGGRRGSVRGGVSAAVGRLSGLVERRLCERGKQRPHAHTTRHAPALRSQGGRGVGPCARGCAQWE